MEVANRRDVSAIAIRLYHSTFQSLMHYSQLLRYSLLPRAFGFLYFTLHGRFLLNRSMILPLPPFHLV